MFNIFKKQTKVYMPIEGEAISMSKVSDETFSQNMMGQGFAIKPTGKAFYAPISGKISLCSGHAFSIKSNNGIEILIHIGIDTVKIPEKTKEKVFKYAFTVGSKVSAGDKIVDVDFSEIKKRKFSTITPVVILSESLNNKKIKILKKGKALLGEEIISIN